MKKIIFLTITIVCLLFIFNTNSVFSAAWWGDGYKPPSWVLSHGGTIIRYTVSGTSHPDDYKAMMFRDGKYIEVEFGKNAVFDDAKNGVYTINFYKCKDSCMPHKFDNKTKLRSSDKKIASITLTAIPGQEVKLIFNASSNSIGVASGIIAKPKPVDPFIAQKNEAKKNEGTQCSVFKSDEKKKLFIKLVLNRDDVEDLKNEDFEKYIELGILPKAFSDKNVETKGIVEK